jgi:hypothetical protein
MPQTIAMSLLSFAAVASNIDGKVYGEAYPSGATVPENLLRIELRFTAPLWHGLDMEHVKLYDVNNNEITQAFLDLPLLSPDGKRVTILMHPGRVKSGVGANLAVGRALNAGSVVTLVVDDVALAQPIRKTWEVAAFDADLPQPSRWTFALPRQQSRDPIVLHLDGPISSSAESLIAIRAPNGERFAGTISLERGETLWRFVPEMPWTEGTYAIAIHPDIEDPAGNRPCGPFEAIAASQVRCDEETVLEFGLLKASHAH